MEFRDLALNYFCYLNKEFNFNQPQYENDVFTESLTYMKKTVAIRISYSLREAGVEVEIIRLIKNKIPPYPILKSDPNQKYYMNLDTILQDKSPNLVFSKPSINEYLKNPFVLKEVLSKYAQALKEYCPDFLSLE